MHALLDREEAPMRHLITDRRGANLVEYIILVGVIALIAIAGFKIFGGKVREKIDQQAGSVGGINGTAK
jgi:pilus assembly protein Flp/PilA